MVIINICFIASKWSSSTHDLLSATVLLMIHKSSKFVRSNKALALTMKIDKIGKGTEFHSFSKCPFTEKISEK